MELIGISPYLPSTHYMILYLKPIILPLHKEKEMLFK